MTDIRHTPQDADEAQHTHPGTSPEPTPGAGPEPAPGASPDAGPDPDSDVDPDVDPLEEEGEVAADYLEELLDTADLDGDIDIEIRDGRVYLSVVAEGPDDGLDVLVGEDGEVLEALQELVRLSVLATTDRRSRLVLDIGGYRRRRAGELQELALGAIREARETGEKVHLEPLSAYERKIVHDVVAEHGLVSESEGEGAARHNVVTVAQG
ncbi:protein jag [Kocuria sp. M1R5S2]|uniref:Jag family protein n=1 Tax=Kocuria rhizosphaerae TaxID=3376285 RepID=UPI00379899FA